MASTHKHTAPTFCKLWTEGWRAREGFVDQQTIRLAAPSINCVCHTEHIHIIHMKNIPKSASELNKTPSHYAAVERGKRLYADDTVVLIKNQTCDFPLQQSFDSWVSLCVCLWENPVSELRHGDPHTQTDTHKHKYRSSDRQSGETALPKLLPNEHQDSMWKYECVFQFEKQEKNNVCVCVCEPHNTQWSQTIRAGTNDFVLLCINLPIIFLD